MYAPDKHGHRRQTVREERNIVPQQKKKLKWRANGSGDFGSGMDARPVRDEVAMHDETTIDWSTFLHCNSSIAPRAHELRHPAQTVQAHAFAATLHGGG